MKKTVFTGSGVAIITPFTENGVNYDELGRLLEYKKAENKTAGPILLLGRFGFDEEERVVKAQAVFALIHGSLISSWIKKDPADLRLAKKSLRDILGDH